MTGYRCCLFLTVFTLSVVVGLEPCEGEIRLAAAFSGHFFLIRGGGRGCKSRFARAFVVRAVNVDRWMGFLQTLIQVWCSSSFRLGEATLGLQCFFLAFPPPMPGFARPAGLLVVRPSGAVFCHFFGHSQVDPQFVPRLAFEQGLAQSDLDPC